VRALATVVLLLLLASGAAAFLVSNSPGGGGFVFESVPANRRPIDVLVDTEAVGGVTSPVAVTQDLMNQWNSVAEAEAVFGTASPGGPYNGTTVGQTFGTFPNTQHEVAFDSEGGIFTFFGVSTGVLGITLKSVNTGSGQLLDFLVVINTAPGVLSAPGSGATAEELFRATLLHELGHSFGLGHTPVGMVNTATGFGLFPAAPAQVPTMYPFRLPQQPQAGGTIEGDDVAAIAAVYPGGAGALGSISGTVALPGGAPVDEIALRAVGPVGQPPERHVGILTNADGADQGRFRITGLPPGAYRVIVEAVNGRSSVDEAALAGGTDSLGGNPFVFAADELWQPGDTFHPGADDPTDFATVEVRAGRDTGSVNLVLNAEPIVEGTTEIGALGTGDALLPGAGGGFHFVDYFVFQGDAGETASIDVSLAGFTPQIRLLSPSDGEVVAAALPFFGNDATLDETLAETGLFTVAISARATSGNPGGSGSYRLELTGAGGALPPAPVVTGAGASAGPNDPGVQQFSSPLCGLPVLQLRLDAPSHEELWVDRVTLRASGTANEPLDVDGVELVHDRNGNGRRDPGEPVVGSGAFTADDGTLVLGGLGIEADAGTAADLLVCLDATIESASSTGLPAVWWAALAVVPLLLLRPRRLAVAAVACLALLPLSCGGGGGNGCNGAFDPAGAVVTFQISVAPGDVEGSTSTGTVVNLPVGNITSGELSISN